jgi:ApaG protein
MKNLKFSNQITIKAKSLFLPDKSNFERPLYFFMYKIEIINEGSEQVQLLTRHWDIQDANGNVNVVNGEGVIGNKPILNPNDMFEYTSYCPLKTNFGSMKGFYTFSQKNGDMFKSLIPEFSLIVPNNIN